MAAKQQEVSKMAIDECRQADCLSRTLDHADDLTGATADAVHGAGGSPGGL